MNELKSKVINFLLHVLMCIYFCIFLSFFTFFSFFFFFVEGRIFTKKNMYILKNDDIIKKKIKKSQEINVN